MLFADLRACSRDSRFSPMRRGCLVTALAAAGVLPSLASAQEAAAAAGQSVQAAPSAALPVVTVRAEASPDQTPAPYAGGQVARGGRLGVLGNQDFMDVPFSITSYTAQAIQNQQAHSIAGVLADDPFIRTSYGFGNFAETFMVRGFQLAGDDLAWNGLYGIAPRQLTATEAVDRVETFRGASAFLNGVSPGGSGIGGGINLVPKYATAAPITQATIDYTSNAQVGGAIDFGRRFGDARQFGVRVNAMARGGETPIDKEDRQQRLLSVGLDYQGDKFRVNADFGYQRQMVQQGRATISLASGITALPPVPKASSSFAQDWTNSMLEDTWGTIRSEYDITRDWTAYAAFGMHHTNEMGNYGGATVGNTGFGTAYRLSVPLKQDTTSGEVGIRGRFVTGPVKHSVNLGWSGLEQEKRSAYEMSASYPTNLYDAPAVARPVTSIARSSMTDPQTTGRTNLNGVSISDTLSFLDERVLLTAGVRRQVINTRAYAYNTNAVTPYSDAATSPMFGLVVKPLQNLSVYYNHIEGLTQGPTPPSTALNRDAVFAPIKSRQDEAGVKYDAGRFGTTLAFFQIRQPNGITVNNVFSVAGEQRNRGVEWSVFGEPLRGLRLLGGVGYIDTKMSNTGNAATEGKQAVGVPNYTVTASAEYDLPFLTGATVSGRYIQTGRQQANATNTISLASWHRFDLGARYAFKASQMRYTVRASVENVANKDYWASSYGGYLVVGNPRTFKLSMTVDY
ncbi:TonB-dependent receptor [Cupriavidus pauculus]|uniref:TonB-dependent receptor n=1 Tax=Cupriavidus pauculus TaxID=82633 RepID=UPI003857A8C8